jgi:hypothetical protein
MTSKFTINNIKIINTWAYNLKFNDTCIICRCNLNSNSVYTLDKDIESSVVIGKCGHAYHYECIDPWIKTNKNCPICHEKWIMQ